jgi:hypothetical protein
VTTAADRTPTSTLLCFYVLACAWIRDILTRPVNLLALCVPGMLLLWWWVGVWSCWGT